MNTISCLKKAWLLMSMLQVFAITAVPAKPAPWQASSSAGCRASIPTATTGSCGATLIPADAFPDCLTVSVIVTDCDATPEVVAHGCLPTGDLVTLGTIAVNDADGVLHSLWELRCVDGTVQVVILDID